MAARKIVVDGRTWLWSVGRAYVTATSEGETLRDLCHVVVGVEPYTMERGQWKRTQDGMVTPSDVRRWIQMKQGVPPGPGLFSNPMHGPPPWYEEILKQAHTAQLLLWLRRVYAAHPEHVNYGVRCSFGHQHYEPEHPMPVGYALTYGGPEIPWDAIKGELDTREHRPRKRDRLKKIRTRNPEGRQRPRQIGVSR